MIVFMKFDFIKNGFGYKFTKAALTSIDSNKRWLIYLSNNTIQQKCTLRSLQTTSDFTEMKCNALN